MAYRTKGGIKKVRFPMVEWRRGFDIARVIEAKGLINDRLREKQVQEEQFALIERCVSGRYSCQETQAAERRRGNPSNNDIFFGVVTKDPFTALRCKLSLPDVFENKQREKKQIV